MMKVLVLSVAAFVGLAGCGANAKEPAAPPAAPAPAPTLAEEVDAMCACKTPACATQVHTDFAAIDRATMVQANRGHASPHLIALDDYLHKCEADAHEGDDMVTLGAYRDDICACKDAECMDRVNKHYATWMAKMEKKYEHGKTPPKALMQVGEQISKCMQTAMSSGDDDDAPSAHHSGGVDGKGAPDATGGGDSVADIGGSTGVPACDLYLRAFDKYMSCPKIPQQAKDASQQGIQQMKEGWAMLRDPNIPIEAKRAAGDACKQAVDALKQSAAAMGCPM